jgi:O-antigen/teichoic acid export membrane protein
LSDAYYGAMQRRGEMDRIARSMIARGVLSAAAFAVVLWISGSLVWAVAALVAGRIALLAGYDRPRGLGGAVDRLKPVPPDRLKPVPPDRLEPVPPGAWGILRQALPLGAVLMLVSLNTNLPRYAIERSLGLAELGAFAAVASFVTAGATVVNALGQAATPRLAQQASSGESGAFLRLAVKLCALAAGLGLAGVLASAALGGPLLALVYRPEYAGYQGLLLGMAGAAIPAYAAAALGYAVTAARAFDAQVPLFCIVAMSCGAASWLLIPRFGLAGAALALACAALVQIAGQAMILRRALRRGEEAL